MRFQSSSSLAGRWVYLLCVTGLFLGLGGCDGGGSSAEPPSAPSGIEASSGDGAITLSWESGSADVSGYNIYRSTSSTSSAEGQPINGSSPVGQTTYTDASAENGTRYYYRVTAVGEGGESRPSAEVSARAFPSPPGRP